MKQRQKFRRTREEWRQIVERSYRTSQAQPEFCKSEGIGLSTLALWRKRLRTSTVPATTKPTKITPLPFVEVSGGSRRSHWEMELVMPNGAMMRIRGEEA